ncbi:MAG TPA: hypothetical protein VIX73_04755 [Kofleriaceae bacterium]|jgi:hypothetical protein
MTDTRKPTPPTTLWEFVQLAAPTLGIVLTPHVQMLCEHFDAALGTMLDVATFHGVDVSERSLREHAQDTLSADELADFNSSPMKIDERHGRAWLGLRRSALAYAAAKLRETGEAGTTAAALLLEQIAEGLT